ncbi:MAG TPA: NUDIX hydrolase [Polyangiaceae bacterium]|nr:NUDIX hydrolase [Polyangiaceae bacterium]
MKRVHDFTWFAVRWLKSYGWIVTRSDAIVVVPESSDGRIWLSLIRRAPTGQRSWELPGGAMDKGEDPVSAGLRELEEECNLVATRGAKLLPNSLEAAPGMGSIPHRVVIALGVEPKSRAARPQKEEGIERVRKFSREQVARMTRAGKISVLPTLGALAVRGWIG